jgi:hypothetical protein
MKTNNKKKLLEYVKKRKNEEIKTLNQLYQKHNGDMDKIVNDEEYRYPLAIEEEGGRILIQLSTGGPGDGFIIYYDRGYYYYTDWGIYEEILLTDEEIKAVKRVYLYDEPYYFSFED